MKLTVFAAVVFPVCVCAQKFSVDRPEEMAKPDPYTETYFADKNDYRRVASLTTIVKDRSNNFTNDTLSIWYYEKGLKVKSVNFNDNKRSTTTVYQYDGKNNLTHWQTQEKRSSTLTKYRYSSKGLLIETRQYTITPKGSRADTVEKSRMLFKYDGLKLVEITNNALGMDMTETYHYSGNLLQSKTGGFVSKQFTRFADGSVSVIKDFMGGTIDSVKLMGIEKFNYDKQGRMIVDSLLTSMNMPTNSYQVTQYRYDAGGQLVTMQSSFGKFYRNAQFTYVNGRMKEVTLETNSNSAYLRFLISHRIPEYYTFPINYWEEFGYDAKGNKTSKKVYVNGELFSEVVYLFVYR